MSGTPLQLSSPSSYTADLKTKNMKICETSSTWTAGSREDLSSLSMISDDSSHSSWRRQYSSTWQG